MKSAITDDMQTCYICGSKKNIQKHHVFNGPFRKMSEKYGMVIGLCVFCHTSSNMAVHQNQIVDLVVKKEAQKRFEELHGHEMFMSVFKKNYL